jgi:hypothetical protein
MQAIMETRQSDRRTAAAAKSVTTYHEETIKGVLYRVTSAYLGKIELGKALEDLTVKKILQQENNLIQSQR